MTAALHLVRDDGEGKQPPHNLDVEAAVLASVLIDPASMPKVSSFLRFEHFYSESHRRIFEGCTALAAANKPIDAVTVAGWLKDRGRIEQVGGMAYLLELIREADAISNVIAYATKIYDHWRVRQTIALCQRVAATGYLDHGDPQEFIDAAARSLVAVGRMSALSPVERNIDLLKRIVREIASASKLTPADDRPVGILTGIPGYDALTLGLHSGEKTTIAALPGGGKSSLGLQIAVSVAQQGIGVLFLSQEMGEKELGERQLAMMASVDSARIKARRMSDPEWRRLHGVRALQKALPIVINDTPNMNMHQVRTATMQQVEMMPVVEGVPLGLVVLDYLQRLDPMPEDASAKAKGRDDIPIANSAKAFKNLCRELKIAGIELAQQAKPDKDKPTARPKLVDFEGCRRIANEADQVIYLHHVDGVDSPHPPGGARVQMLLLKQRGGRRGEVSLRLRGEFSRFDEVVEEEQMYRPASRDFLDTKRAAYGDDT